MELGLRASRLVIAIILFIVAVSKGDTAFNFLAIGLACVAAALLAGAGGFSTAGRCNNP